MYSAWGLISLAFLIDSSRLGRAGSDASIAGRLEALREAVLSKSADDGNGSGVGEDIKLLGVAFLRTTVGAEGGWKLELANSWVG
jgi:hypothetical protein